jgi:putative FmdB family regulatory protein
MEEMQSMSAKALVKCPVCGKNTLKRLIGTGSGIIFKGSGFYLTDYKNKSSKTSEKSSTEKTTGSKSKDSQASKTGETTKTTTNKKESK